MATAANIVIKASSTTYNKVFNTGDQNIIYLSALELVLTAMVVAAVSADITMTNAVLAAPENFTAVRAGDYLSCQLDWDEVPGATQYEVFRSTGYRASPSVVQTVGTNTYNDTGLTAGQTYFYSVRGITATEKGRRCLPVYAPADNETHG